MEFVFFSTFRADQKMNGGVHLPKKIQKKNKNSENNYKLIWTFFNFLEFFGPMYSSIHFLIGSDFVFITKIQQIR